MVPYFTSGTLYRTKQIKKMASGALLLLKKVSYFPLLQK